LFLQFLLGAIALTDGPDQQDEHQDRKYHEFHFDDGGRFFFFGGHAFIFPVKRERKTGIILNKFYRKKEKCHKLRLIPVGKYLLLTRARRLICSSRRIIDALHLGFWAGRIRPVDFWCPAALFSARGIISRPFAHG
jgi:hypothetical protein